MPCKDEGHTVGDVVAGLASTLPGCTVYVYDNGSVDDTARKAAAAGAVVRSETTPGKGGVVRRMFADVDADIYLMIDGDGTYPLTNHAGTRVGEVRVSDGGSTRAGP